MEAFPPFLTALISERVREFCSGCEEDVTELLVWCMVWFLIFQLMLLVVRSHA